MSRRNTPFIVNCRFLTQPVSGVQRFAIEICRELKKLDDQFIFVAPKNILHSDIFRELKAIVIGRFQGHLWEQVDLKRYVDKHNGLLVSLGNTGPLFVKKQVVTIHDLGFRHHPEWFSFGFRKVYNFLIPKIVKKALHVFTVSETSKKELEDILGAEKTKISVIYNAATPFFEDLNCINKHEDEKYILTVSSHVPRKNFKRLINSFSKISNKKIKLIIVGNYSSIYAKEDLTENNRVIFEQNIGDQELATYYKNATLFVYPSLYEGFGIPIIEAASYGTSICVSDIPVFQEICGQQAIYFDPLDEIDMTNKIQESLKNPIVPNSSFFQKKYSWEKSALKMFSILKEI
ncbi:glycosyltransferase family 4 protein [Aquimarina sp. MMG015]|uniref:glycosyltransferase family 4 protein n=1 Tax=Aquimarina sp. MMG015 TaxID=2822689 RepID=UPI001B3A3F0C|nr:glycosyltransferase family 1 protein [Aquimarina sp. MMG015]MBQ4801396.1 glycosyltransferase family 4 protein [Aquimarina sp. MMG015]